MSTCGQLIPSLLLPEVYAPWKFERGFVARQIENAAADGFYRSVEISRIPDRVDRDAIRSVCAEHGIKISCWLTQVIDDEKLDLTSIDASQRQRSVEAIKRHIPEAVASGATTIALIGGSDPGPALRERGYDGFVSSMMAICAAATDVGASVMFEPLDRFAHKKRLVGPTGEAVAAFARVRAEHPSFGLAFDTAHAALNEEDIPVSLALGKDQIVNLHLSNAVLDKADPLYGDHHIMPGAPGFLTIERAVAILGEVIRLGIGAGRGLPVAIEARAQPADGQQSAARLATNFLKAVLDRTRELSVA